MTPFPVMLLTFFTKRAFKGHSKGTWTLQGLRKGTLALGHLKSIGHLGTRTLEALWHSRGTWAFGHARHSKHLT